MNIYEYLLCARHFLDAGMIHQSDTLSGDCPPIINDLRIRTGAKQNGEESQVHLWVLYLFTSLCLLGTPLPPRGPNLHAGQREHLRRFKGISFPQ